MTEESEANGAEVSDVMSGNEREYDDSDHDLKDEDDNMATHASPEPGTDGELKKKYDPKDPNRPRRKKAKRACFACQRAHLTCGDERPCARCLKRGLHETCQDGVRKKAKYLHDAPAEALQSVLGAAYNPVTAPAEVPDGRHLSTVTTDSSASSYPQSAPPQSYPLYGGTQQPIQGMGETMIYSGQPSPIMPNFQRNNSQPQLSTIQVPAPTQEINGFPSAIFDPTNASTPATYNFDLEGLNFLNQYGAMEFGMLGHMSSGASDPSPQDRSITQGSNAEMNFASGQMYQSGVPAYNQPMYEGAFDNFLSPESHGGNMYAQGNLQHGLPHAYAIAASGPTPTSLASPATENTASPQPTPTGAEGNSNVGTSNLQPSTSQALGRNSKPKIKPSSLRFSPQSILGKRQRDYSDIYDKVRKPYEYVASFHILTALLKQRFTTAQTYRIAESMGAIRPSFLACMEKLGPSDFVFMEKMLQRSLCNFEEHMGGVPSPTLICRRTGEVAGVNKEFLAMTGWPKNVLLGKEASSNINTGYASSAEVDDINQIDPGSSQFNGDQREGTKPSNNKPRPIFFPELLDDESVVQFYEDYAQLAFANSHGHAIRKCQLLKYRTKDSDKSSQKDARASILSNRVTRIDGDYGVSKIAKDGRIDCAYRWIIKRDMFDIPMLIVITLLPCYTRSQEQLAI